MNRHTIVRLLGEIPYSPETHKAMLAVRQGSPISVTRALKALCESACGGKLTGHRPGLEHEVNEAIGFLVDHQKSHPNKPIPAGDGPGRPVAGRGYRINCRVLDAIGEQMQAVADAEGWGPLIERLWTERKI